MKVKTVSGTSPSSDAEDPLDAKAEHPCRHCGKMFSNRSNRNRHEILSCESKRDNLNSIVVAENEEEESFEDPEEIEEEKVAENGENSEEREKKHKCPYPKCDVFYSENIRFKEAFVSRSQYSQYFLLTCPIWMQKKFD